MKGPLVPCALLLLAAARIVLAQVPAPPPPTYFPGQGHAAPPVTFSAARVDFGKVPWSAQPFLMLTVSLSPAVFSPSTLPRLTCSDKDVLVSLASQTVPPPHLLPTRTQPPPIVQVWRLTLTNRPRLGLLRGTFVLTTDADPASPEAAALRGTVLPPLTGEVEGAFRAASSNILLGTTTAGQSVTHTTTLSAAAAAALKGMKTASASPFLTATVAPPVNAGGGVWTATLSVTLGAQAPAGSLETSVSVTNGGGQTLVLPVFVNIDPAQK